MARVIPKIEAPAPTRTTLPHGLFSVLAFPTTTGDVGAEAWGRWEGAGVEYVGVTCDPAGGIPGWDCDPADPAPTLAAPEGASTSWGEGDSFQVYGWHRCGPASLDEGAALAAQHLLNREEARVERAFWTGDLGNRPNLTTGLDADSPVEVGGADLSPAAAIAELEGWAARYGSQAVLHTSRPVASRLLSAGVLDVRSGRLVTKLGLPVVAGAGYEDDGRVVATGALAGYRGEVQPFDPAGATFDHRTNDTVAYAVRPYVLWADACGAYSVTVAP